jgi:hypothetical protein
VPRQKPKVNLNKRLEDFYSKDINDRSGGHDTNVYKKIPKKSAENPQKINLRNEKQWYVKTSYSRTEPLELEVTAGEVYRFWIGNSQPKTRLIIDNAENRYVGSEGVFNFKTFKDNFDLKTLDIKTFARILVCAMILAETDLKLDNIGTNGNDKAVKIDHDSSFWPIVARKMSIISDLNNINFTYEDLENILFPKTYKVAAWGGGLPYEIRKEISASKEFQDEVNYQILKILTLPNQWVEIIKELNAPEDDWALKQDISNFLEKRVQILRREAFKSNKFITYLNNLDIPAFENKIQSEMKEFWQENRNYEQMLEGDYLESLDVSREVTHIKIDRLKAQLKINSSNEENLAYWQNKTTQIKGFGGTKMSLNNKKYRVPDRVARIMNLETNSFDSYEGFKNAVDEVRYASSNNNSSFFAKAKNKVTRNPATKTFYETKDLEQVDLPETPVPTPKS